ncbi:MAG: GvpL/GvpF family gas vesicle protein [Candidatus Binatia bacterium]
MAEEGKYIYCIIAADGKKNLGPLGIGGKNVHTVCYESLAAVVSDSPVMKYPITRENTLAHQRVMEEVMKHHTVLPVKFSTIAESQGGVAVEERIRAQVLERRYEEFEDLVGEMRDKVELGVKALWRKMDAIFAEIVSENSQVKALKNRIAAKPSTPTHGLRMKLGEMVKDALETKREIEANHILTVLKNVSVEVRKNKTFGDKMVANFAYLVETERVEEFDERLSRLSTEYEQRGTFKYVGPVPICNFVELEITWDD